MRLLSLIASLALIVGCGGGGGGSTGSATVNGRVINLTTGAPPDPAVSVQAGSRSTQTAADGSFTISADENSTSLLVLNPSPPVTFRFDFDPFTGSVDVGDLWIGPESVNVAGKVLDANSGQAVASAVVALGGKTATSGSDGRFSVTAVAYDSNNLPAFFGLPGRIIKPGYLPRDFFPNVAASGGIANIGDLTMTPEGSATPPPVPYNIEGFVSPTSDAAGTVVVLKRDGAPIRQTTVGSDNRYSFFVSAGTYTATYHNPLNNKSAPDETLVLSASNQVIRKDVTLR